MSAKNQHQKEAQANGQGRYKLRLKFIHFRAPNFVVARAIFLGVDTCAGLRIIYCSLSTQYCTGPTLHTSEAGEPRQRLVVRGTLTCMLDAVDEAEKIRAMLNYAKGFVPTALPLSPGL